MKKQILISLIGLSFLVPTGCQPRKENKIFNATNSYIRPDEGEIQVIGSEDAVAPFSTSLNATVYYQDGDYTQEEITTFQEDFASRLNYFHALSDRHYDYRYEDGRKITNVKTINDSYGKEEEIVVDDFLFNLLKESVNFAIHSQGKFNPFLGELNDLYDPKIESVQNAFVNGEEMAWRETTHMFYGSFSSEEKDKIQSIVENLPLTEEDFKQVLTFDEARKSVTFHSFKKAAHLEISLGGNAKGFATEALVKEFQTKYPNLSLILNSGESSIKAVGKRPDGRNWNIRYNNPIYYAIDFPFSSKNPYNKEEVKLEVNGGFNLSTSGYYLHYFYDLDKETGIFNRRNHILNPQTGYAQDYFDQVSVFIDNAGLADMYTTALMNCSSLEEANSLFSSLNETYQETDAGVIYCYLSLKDSLDKYPYSLKDYAPLSSYQTPIMVLDSGDTYEGDYQSVNPLQWKESKTRFTKEIQENYCFSSNLYPHASMLEAKDLSFPDQVISVIRPLE